jgi:hypothetical protein
VVEKASIIPSFLPMARMQRKAKMLARWLSLGRDLEKM